MYLLFILRKYGLCPLQRQPFLDKVLKGGLEFEQLRLLGLQHKPARLPAQFSSEIAWARVAMPWFETYEWRAWQTPQAQLLTARPAERQQQAILVPIFQTVA